MVWVRTTSKPGTLTLRSGAANVLPRLSFMVVPTVDSHPHETTMRLKWSCTVRKMVSWQKSESVQYPLKARVTFIGFGGSAAKGEACAMTGLPCGAAPAADAATLPVSVSATRRASRTAAAFMAFRGNAPIFTNYIGRAAFQSFPT